MPGTHRRRTRKRSEYGAIRLSSNLLARINKTDDLIQPRRPTHEARDRRAPAPRTHAGALTPRGEGRYNRNNPVVAVPTGTGPAPETRLDSARTGFPLSAPANPV